MSELKSKEENVFDLDALVGPAPGREATINKVGPSSLYISFPTMYLKSKSSSLASRTEDTQLTFLRYDLVSA